MKALCMALISMAAAASLAAEDVSVTVYNSNLGVVSEVRSLEFSSGVHKVAFKDVPAQIDPASVRFEPVGSSQNIAILEQNYAFDLVSTGTLFSRYIDHEISLLDKDGKLISGTLFASDNNNVTLLEKDGSVRVVRLENIAEVNFPNLPDGLVTRPTLFWLYNSDYSGAVDCRVGYQTNGMDWSAEYVGLLNKDESTLDLSGWASITNNTNKTFADARLKLIAGDISRTYGTKGRPERVLMAAKDAMSAGAGFDEKAFFEYHMYTLPRRATLASSEVKQISLFEPASTGVKKEYVFRPDQSANQVEVMINFVNSKKTGLGMPLPEGRVRLFKSDDDGAMVLLGEDMIKHTPRDEELDIRVGYAFDIAAEERLMNQNRISNQIEERDFEVELRNRKEEDVTIKVVKTLYGSIEVLDSNFPHHKKDARTIEFEVPVAAGNTVTLSYKVRLSR